VYVLPTGITRLMHVLYAASYMLLLHMSISFLLVPEISSLQRKCSEMDIPREEEVATYYKLRQQLDKLGKEMQQFIVMPKYCVPFLQPGRMVKVGHRLYRRIMLMQCMCILYNSVPYTIRVFCTFFPCSFCVRTG